MIHRKRIVGVRLAPDELEKLNAYIERKPHLDFSRVIRLALSEFFERYGVERPITALNTRSGVKQPMPLFDKKRQSLKGKKKMPKKTAKIA